MQRLYVIDPTNFKGSVINTMSCLEGVPQFMDYMKEPTTFEQYKEDNPNLIALDWETFEKEYYRPYLNSLCGEFKPTTKEEFWELLEVLPPERWEKREGKEFFFVGECNTADLYTCFVRIADKYWTAWRPIRTPETDLFNLKPVSL